MQAYNASRLYREAGACFLGALGIWGVLGRLVQECCGAVVHGWYLISASVLAVLLWRFWKGLPWHRSPSNQGPYPTLGAANGVTLLRGVLLAGLWGFLALPSETVPGHWLPGMLFTLGVALDYLDGYLARRTHQVSLLGQRMDVFTDGLAVLGGSLLAVHARRVPVWYILVGAAYYLFLFGQAWRRRRGLPVFPLPPSMTRRALAGMQMGFLAAVLWPLFPKPATRWAAYLFGLPFLLHFFLDWLAVSGRRPGLAMPALSPRIRNGLRLALRWAGLMLWLWWLTQRSFFFRQPLAAFSLPTALVLFLIRLLAGYVLLGLLLGWTARTAAMLGMGLVGLHAALTGRWSTAEAMTATLLAGVMYLGSGPLTLWAPEDLLLQRRAGEKESQP